MDLFSDAFGIATKGHLHSLALIVELKKNNNKCPKHVELGIWAKMVSIMVTIWLSATVALKLFLKLAFTVSLYV